jgi:AraC family transcriptional regulator of arabinose operon
MAGVMKDQLYILEPGHLFTSLCVAARFTFRFYVLIVVCPEGGQVRLTSGASMASGSALVVRPGAEWLLEIEGDPVVAALVNPLHPLFARFRAIKAPGVMPLELAPFLPYGPAMLQAYRGELDVPRAAALFDQLIHSAADQLGPVWTRPPRWLNELTAWLDDPADDLEQLAAKVGVSSDRMSRLFQNAVGLPLRSYLLWRKTHRIAALFSEGLSLTDIAHAAGFTDSAHMCHMFQDVFGAPPSHFLRSDLVRVQAWLGQPRERVAEQAFA